jgi:cell division transport system permease protein
MKIKNGGYLIKQGLQSIMRNKMMSLASISTVMASLLILGIYLITMFNVNAMVKNVEAGVEIKVFLTNDITNSQMTDIESKMKETKGVTDVTYESKQQALENFKKQLGENADLVRI